MLFPRLACGLVSSLNRDAFEFDAITAVPKENIEQSLLQKALLFELAVVRAEHILHGGKNPNWGMCIEAATKRQSRHYDAKLPGTVEKTDMDVADHAAKNLVGMLECVSKQQPDDVLVFSPKIPGMGWIASGNGDFSIGKTLIEVKHTSRNFGSGDFRQVLMYWILKYAGSIENNDDIWTDCLLLNPRRNSALRVNFDRLSRAASTNLGRVELCELLQTITRRGRIEN
jgi:hypothetical protein